MAPVTCLVRKAEAVVALAGEGTVGVDALCVVVAVVRRCCRDGLCYRALIHVATVEAITPVAWRRARAVVAGATECTEHVRAVGVFTAEVGACSTLIDITAGDTIARVSRWTRAREGPGSVCAIVGIEAVVRARRALVDLDAVCRRRRVAGAACARTTNKVWGLRRTREACTSAWSVARGATCIACSARGAVVGVKRCWARGKARARVELGCKRRTARALGRARTSAGRATGVAALAHGGGVGVKSCGTV